MQARTRSALALGATAAWSLLAVAMYQAGAAGRLAPFLHQGPRLALLAGMLLAASGAGQLTIAALRLPERGLVWRLVFGWLVLSYLWLALGAVGLFRPAAAWGLLASGAALGGSLLLLRPRGEPSTPPAVAPPAPAAAPTTPPPPAGTLTAALLPLGLALAGVLLVLPMALAPPTSTDELTYHLTVPRWYLQAGRLLALPDVALAAYPFQVEMLYTWALLLGAPVVAKLNHFAMGIVATTLAAREAARAGGATAAGCAAALLLCTPLILVNMSWAVVDVATGLFVLAGCLCLLRLRETWTPREGLAAGLVWGMALGTKYTAALYLGVALLGWLWPRRPEPLALALRLRRAALVGGVALALVTPYLLRNTLVHGNPVHPIGDSIWGRGDLVNENLLHEDSGQRDTWVDRFLGPVAYAVGGSRGDETLGAAWLLLAPLLPFAPLSPRARWLLWCGLVPALVLATGFGATVRVQVPTLFLLAVPAGEALGAWMRSGGARRLAVVVVLILSAVSQLAILAWHDRAYYDPVRVALGFEAEPAYLDRMEPSWVLLEWLNRQAPPDTRVLALGAERLFWLERPVVASSVLDVSPALAWLRLAQRPEGVSTVLRAHGVTHLLFDREGFRRRVREGGGREAWTAADLRLLDAYLERHAVKLARRQRFELYGVERR